MHNNANDITGNRYGKLVVLEATNERYSNGSVKWKCQCDCGNIYYTCSSDLKRGRKSCGCETRLIDLKGQKFGRLTVIERAKDKKGKTYWHCKCECGDEKDVCASHLTSGKIVSCGCSSVERISKLNKTHGMSKTRIYGIWAGMKGRCYNQNNSEYSIYGGRGITICPEWKDDFQAFYDWAMANGYQDDLTIDRIDVNGNYDPSNCRWATNKEQSLNKRETIYFELFGVEKPLFTWCEYAKANYRNVYQKYKRGSYPFTDKEIKTIKNNIENGGIENGKM